MLPLLAQLANDTIVINNINANFNYIRGLTPASYVTTAINLLLGAAGVTAFIFLLWGGLQWIMAGSDKDAAEKARKRIIQALVGVSIVFSAYAILFIIRVLFNVNVIGFTLRPLGS